MHNPGDGYPLDFLDHFVVARVVSDEQRARVARLRHDVFCDELGVEAAQPSRLESDHYDAQALCCLLTHRASGRAAACVRIIRATEHTLLPMEDHSLASLHVGCLQKLNWHRDLACELSRLAVAPAFRSAAQRGLGAVGEPQSAGDRPQGETAGRRNHPLLWRATLLAALATAENAGRTQLYAMVDPRLARILRRSGVPLEQVGDFTRYHGGQAAFAVDSAAALARLSPTMRALFDAIKTQLDGDQKSGHAATA